MNFNLSEKITCEVWPTSIVENCNDIDKVQEERFSDENEVLPMNETFLEETTTCDFCNKTFQSVSKMERHKRNVHSKKMSECNVCGVVIRTSSLKRHKKTMHEKTDKTHQLKCDICGNQYSTELTLKVHQKKHLNPFSCNLCDKKLTTKHSLDLHIQNIHEGRKYYCDICDKVFNWECGLLEHRKTHDSNFKQFRKACDKCGKIFNTRSNYRLHLQTHQGGCPCEVCGTILKNSEILRLHMLIHSGVKAYNCKFCDKKFARSSTLVMHQRTHTGEKPYGCTVCGKKFTQSTPLVIHMRGHTGERPYSCAHCTESFTNKTLLDSHLQNTHQIVK